MKNIIRWLFMYGVYWFIAALACDGLYEAGVGLNNAVDELIRVVLPIVLVLITALVFRFSKKKNADTEDKDDSMPIVDAAMKIFGIIFAGFFYSIGNYTCVYDVCYDVIGG